MCVSFRLKQTVREVKMWDRSVCVCRNGSRDCANFLSPEHHMVLAVVIQEMRQIGPGCFVPFLAPPTGLLKPLNSGGWSWHPRPATVDRGGRYLGVVGRQGRW